MEKKQLFLPLLLGLFIWLLATLIVVQILGVETGEEILSSSQQPRTIQYHADDPYEIQLVKKKQSLSSRYIIRICKKDNPANGYEISYPDQNKDTEESWADLAVEWYAEGIRLTFGSEGLQYFIPAVLFTEMQ